MHEVERLVLTLMVTAATSVVPSHPFAIKIAVFPWLGGITVGRVWCQTADFQSVKIAHKVIHLHPEENVYYYEGNYQRMYAL